MINYINLIQVAFYSAFVSCGLAVLRSTKFNLLPYIYISAFCASFVFNGLNSVTDTFIAGIVAGFISAAMVGIFHRQGKHGYLFIIIPVIYCMGPGSAMYKSILYIMQADFNGAVAQLIYTAKDAFGIWSGILIGTEFMNRITGKKSEKFY